MITQQQALEALERFSWHMGRPHHPDAAILRQYIEQQAEDAELLDCSEYGHDDGCCGNASCMRVKK